MLFLLRIMRGKSVPNLFPCLLDDHLSLMFLHYLPSVCVHVQISSFYGDTSHIGLWPHLNNLILT